MFSWGKCARKRAAYGDVEKKGLTENCVTHIIRLRELYYSRCTVCDEVLQYLFMRFESQNLRARNRKGAGAEQDDTF